MTSPHPRLEQSTGRPRQPEAPAHGHAPLAAPRESVRTSAPGPTRADVPPPPRASAWGRAETSPPHREAPVRHATYPQGPWRRAGLRSPGRGAGPGDGQDPPLYRALLARWTERGATLPLRGDPEWERLAAPPVPWFSGPQDRAGGGR
ncbi:hypothetical protein ABZV64_08745 [Streptomyces sp. NPDC004959]|uniref:hypothetical protein n=1 Tax=unclassified Streptomyces TaxID=2593676 RepID=UPI0009973457|nr:hypothetical protein [Streptomyces sp. NRRL F-5630]